MKLTISFAFRYFIINPIKFWLNLRKNYQQLEYLIKHAERKKLINKTIVINTVRIFRNSIDTELFLGLKLAVNGAKVKILFDDGYMMHWDSTQMYQIRNLRNIEQKQHNLYYFNNSYDNIFTKRFLYILIDRRYRKKAVKTYQKSELEIIYYSEFFDKLNLSLTNLEDLKKHAESALIRFNKSSNIDYNARHNRYYYLLSLKNAIISRAVGEYILNTLKPDYTITAHGTYSTHGPSFEYLKKNGKNAYMWAGSNVHSGDTSNIYILDNIAQLMGSSTLLKIFKEKPLTNEMKDKVNEYFNRRTKGLAKDQQVWKYMITNKQFEVNKDDGYKYHICLFPNIIWDGNIRERHVAFNDYLDWIYSTIEYLKNREDIKLYIKAHPNEYNVCPPEERVIYLIKKKFDVSTIKNLVLIPPELKIDTYQFIKSGIDLCIVYDGFLGLELPFLRQPTITCTKGGYSYVSESNITISTKEEYFQHLDNVGKFIKQFFEKYDSFRPYYIKFLYWYLFYNLIKIPTMKDYYELGPHYGHVTLNDLVLEDRLKELFSIDIT